MTTALPYPYGRFFGERWDAPRVEESIQVPTPVGELCLHCEEPIEEGDRGVLMPYIDAGMNTHVRAVHMECDLRAVLGGIAHLERRCTCYGGTDHDDNNMTRRESALATLAFIERRRGKPL